MKKTISTILAVMLLCLTMSGCAQKDMSHVATTGLDEYLADYGGDLSKGPLYKSTVVVYNWGEYMDNDNLNKQFQELTGIKVRYRNFDSNEALRSTLMGGGASYDIIIPSDYMIGQMIEEGLLQTIDTGKLSNYQYIDEQYRSTGYDPDNRYSVPYMTGTVGLVYNTAMITDPVDSWDALFDERYSGQILMFDNPRDALGIALKKLGYSFNTTNTDEIQEAFELLKSQKPLVQAYVMDQIYDKMIGGEAAIGPYYAGDALMMIEENSDLTFVHPKEGVNSFIDAFAIPKSAKNVAAAYLYIDFMCSAEAGLANVEATGYATPLTNVKELLDDEQRENEIMFPGDEVIAKSEIFLSMPKNIRELYDQLWVDLGVE